MVRTKIQAIEQARKRNNCFLKRKKGLFKKAMELSILCEAEVTLIVTGTNKKILAYSSTDIAEALACFHRCAKPEKAWINDDYESLYGGDDEESPGASKKRKKTRTRTGLVGRVDSPLSTAEAAASAATTRKARVRSTTPTRPQTVVRPIPVFPTTAHSASMAPPPVLNPVFVKQDAHPSPWTSEGTASALVANISQRVASEAGASPSSTKSSTGSASTRSSRRKKRVGLKISIPSEAEQSATALASLSASVKAAEARQPRSDARSNGASEANGTATTPSSASSVPDLPGMRELTAGASASFMNGANFTPMSPRYGIPTPLPGMMSQPVILRDKGDRLWNAVINFSPNPTDAPSVPFSGSATASAGSAGPDAANARSHATTQVQAQQPPVTPLTPTGFTPGHEPIPVLDWPTKWVPQNGPVDPFNLLDASAVSAMASQYAADRTASTVDVATAGEQHASPRSEASGRKRQRPPASNGGAS